MTPPFITGLAIGFTIAVPVGPVGVLCLKRSLRDGRLAGLISGLGAATADAIYGLIAALGLTFITNELLAHQREIQLGGGIFLLLLGINMLRAKPASVGARTVDSPRLKRAFFSTLALTLTNPMTILAFVGIFAGFGIGAGGGGGGTSTSCWLVSGVFVGSAIWWTILSSSAEWLGKRMQQGGLRVFHAFAGILIAGFGVWQLIRLALDR
ncbi:MAG TPA: LysE family transporter [Opitutaceae bacterium]|nr:LysE family transporter [Opitutaceae bacterium]